MDALIILAGLVLCTWLNACMTVSCLQWWSTDLPAHLWSLLGRLKMLPEAWRLQPDSRREWSTWMHTSVGRNAGFGRLLSQGLTCAKCLSAHLSFWGAVLLHTALPGSVSWWWSIPVLTLTSAGLALKLLKDKEPPPMMVMSTAPPSPNA